MRCCEEIVSVSSFLFQGSAGKSPNVKRNNFASVRAAGLPDRRQRSVSRAIR